MCIENHKFMNQNITDLQPQNSRISTEVIEWVPVQDPVSAEVIEFDLTPWDKVEILDAPKRVQRSPGTIPIYPVPAVTREMATQSQDRQPFVWTKKDTVTVVRFVTPVALGVGGAYGVYVLLSFLIAQTAFWLVIGGVAAVTVLRWILSHDTRQEVSTPVDRQRGGDVITNVHVNGSRGNVITNVFVNYQNDEI